MLLTGAFSLAEDRMKIGVQGFSVIEFQLWISIFQTLVYGFVCRPIVFIGWILNRYKSVCWRGMGKGQVTQQTCCCFPCQFLAVWWAFLPRSVMHEAECWPWLYGVNQADQTTFIAGRSDGKPQLVLDRLGKCQHFLQKCRSITNLWTWLHQSLLLVWIQVRALHLSNSGLREDSGVLPSVVSFHTKPSQRETNLQLSFSWKALFKRSLSFCKKAGLKAIDCSTK